MSVLVKGCKMPISCADCFLEDAYDGYNCRIALKTEIWGLGERPSWCPLVEAPDWIPVKSRPMDEEERAEWSVRIGYDIEDEDAAIYTSQMPDDGEEVLTCDRYGNVRLDTFSNDPEYGCFFEDNGDMDGITAWMPKPKPYEPPKEE